MAKRLCKFDRREIPASLGEIAQLVAEPKFVCRSCTRSAHDASSLCKPLSLNLDAENRTEKQCEISHLKPSKKALKKQKKANKKLNKLLKKRVKILKKAAKVERTLAQYQSLLEQPINQQNINSMTQTNLH